MKYYYKVKKIDEKHFQKINLCKMNKKFNLKIIKLLLILYNKNNFNKKI